MEYELYHDESLVSGYWHGMLLVPINKKNKLISLLELARNNTSYKYALSMKHVDRKGIIYGCALSWITIGVASLASNFKNQPPYVYLGESSNGKRIYDFMPELIGSKFILFCEKDKHQTMNNYPDYASRIETTFRMGLKGGLHFLGCEESPIEIVRMHFDGYEHYLRHIDKSRIVDRLFGLRNYCKVINKPDLIDDRTGNHQRDGCQSYDDCQLLQLTDLLIGSFRTVLGEMTKDIHGELSKPVLSLIKRYEQGYARMKNSRWWKSFCISKCFLYNYGWQFSTIELVKKDYQLLLPF